MSVVKNLSFKSAVKLQVLFHTLLRPHSKLRHEDTSTMSQDAATTNLVSIPEKAENVYT